MLNLSCPPWALGRLNSGALAPTSGTASFCLRRVNMRPSLRVRKVLPEYYRLGALLTRQRALGGSQTRGGALVFWGHEAAHDTRVHALRDGEQRLRPEPVPRPRARGGRGAPRPPGRRGARS